MINVIAMCVRVCWFLVRKFALILTVIFAFSITMFSGFASSVGTILSTVGITTAATDLGINIAELKADNTKLKKQLALSNKQLTKTQKTAESLKTNLQEANSKFKDLSKKNNQIVQSLKQTKKVQQNITKIADRSVARGARLLALNAGSTVAEAGVGWFPYAGLAIGAGSLAWELNEICGQMDDMDQISVMLNAPKADRGAFSYLCKGDEISSNSSVDKDNIKSDRKILEHDGKSYTQVYPDEIYFRRVFRLHDKYHSLLRANKIEASKQLKGITFDTYEKTNDLIIYQVDADILIELNGYYYQLY